MVAVMSVSHRKRPPCRSFDTEIFSLTIPQLPLRLERTNLLLLTLPTGRKIPCIPFMNLSTCDTHLSSSPCFTSGFYTRFSNLRSCK
ncbi:hypothetical protein L873DRAFT_615265 [Choiromyces venosus 120613-1]|uniref:Uncharacterized protein n=1 Tax=Choiromyces venosus 120613-1 TaxID=1336337 RepID=A0A3N4IY36_9PEZI|nr:hypothetical protein L873DRAFT_615265 [Choiromyces venosus 120613-1]